MDFGVLYIIVSLNFISRSFAQLPKSLIFCLKSGPLHKKGPQESRLKGEMLKLLEIVLIFLRAMFTLYRIVKRSVAESVPDRASVHTRNAASKQFLLRHSTALLRC